jgi:response regulator RpfG family c-di-GMP phosphodiesterase
MKDIEKYSDPGMEMVARLRLACEAHDAGISQHLDRVSRYACDIGRLMGLSDPQLAELRLATPLHDLGKIALPIELLNKVGRLTHDEMETIKTHTVVGYRIMDGSTWSVMQCAARIALSHHECWDGSGYPYNLVGEAIPVDARIVAVADVYDALMSQRAYKPAWEEDMVIAEMRRLREVKFEPAILDLFIDNLPVLSQELS